MKIYRIYMQCCLSQPAASLLPAQSVSKSQQIMPNHLCSLSNTSETFLSAPCSQQLRFSSTLRLIQTSRDFLTPFFCLPQHTVSMSMPDSAAPWEVGLFCHQICIWVNPSPARHITCKIRRHKDTICPVLVSTHQK